MNRTLPDMMRDRPTPLTLENLFSRNTSLPRTDLIAVWKTFFHAYGWTLDEITASYEAEIVKRLKEMPEVAADD